MIATQRWILKRTWPAFLALMMLISSTGCSPDWLSSPSPPAQPTATTSSEPTPVPMPVIPKAEINFYVDVPENTPPDATIFLSVLDEVTGLALNAENYPMEPDDDGENPGSLRYALTLPMAMGSAVKYRYERQSGTARVIEHISDGRPVRYRLYHVEGPGTVQDVVSRWTDTRFDGPTSRIKGQVTDAETSAPLPGLLVMAGGAQAFTTSDGSFLIEGLPPGVHNLVVFAMDGSYRTFQQGARVAADSTTPAPVTLSPAPMVSVVFVVKLPGDTPPVVPVRLAGSLYQTGNSFANLSGGTSALAVNMPVMEPLPDGRYTITLSLPAGADLRYKYTLGDGFWNAEHTSSGGFQLRQVVVPEENVVVEDVVDTWHSGKQAPITFDLHVPENTPSEDTVSIQFNPLFGWTEPVPMWHLATDQWAYVLYSPLNLPGDLNYRYCRNGQCGRADAIMNGEIGASQPVSISLQAQEIHDKIDGWVGIGADTTPQAALPETIRQTNSIFMAGVEFQAAYHPSWKAYLPDALANIQSMGANWLILCPTWTFTRNSPPVLEPVAGEDALWIDLIDTIKQSQAAGFTIGLHPRPHLPDNLDAWWENAPRDFAWWLGWFEDYHQFALNFADLATQIGAPVLILGGSWMTPALPGGKLLNGAPSGVPADAEARWREILTDVRAHYNGRLLWAMPASELDNPPAFIDAVDEIYFLWTPLPAEQPDISAEQLQADLTDFLDRPVRTVQLLYNKPVIVGVFYPSAVDLQSQANAYNAALNVINQRDWITGFVSRGYYPAAALQDNSASVRDKPAGEVLKSWFSGMLNGEAP
jgi:hypothetical protein